MKKIYKIAILFGILILISTSAFATEYAEKQNKKRENAYKAALDSYMKTFMTDETPEEDKISSYEYSGFGLTAKGETEDKLYVNIAFNITPVNENNTTWSKYGNNCYAVFSKVNDEYVLDRISRYPDNYEEFLERFEEYKKNKSETKENIQIQGQEITNNLANQEIEKMSNIIYISCLIIFIATICFISIKIYRRLY